MAIYLVKSYNDVVCACSTREKAERAVVNEATDRGDFPNHMYRWNIESVSFDDVDDGEGVVWRGDGCVYLAVENGVVVAKVVQS